MKFLALAIVAALSINSASAVVCQYCTQADNWVEPKLGVHFTVTTNATNPVRVGDVIEYNCTAHNMPMETNTLEWKQVMSRNVEYRRAAGRSPLTWYHSVTAIDHNTQIFCGVSYSEPSESWWLNQYYAKSDNLPALQVEGISTTAAPPTENGEQLGITVTPIQASYNVGDRLEYVCTTANIRSAMFNIIQSKGNFEMQIYSGYQSDYRWLWTNLTKADDGTDLFCQAWMIDWRYNSYMLPSERFTINVN